MFTAIDKIGEKRIKVNIWDTIEDHPYYCPICDQELTQKRGPEKADHFAHYPTSNKYKACPDKWHYDMSDWHRNWQSKFPIENTEVVITKDGITHRADVCINDVVIEFQHSHISLDDFHARNDFYASVGYKVVWLFDMTDSYIEKEDINKYKYSYVSNLFKNIDDIFYENATVYFQLNNEYEFDDFEFDDFDEDDFENDNFNYRIERLSHSYKQFKLFYTDKKHNLSIDDFSSLANNEPLKLVDFRKVKNLDGCKTISELWKPEYRGMIVVNLLDYSELLVLGKDGNVLRDDGDPQGKIIAKYYEEDSTWSQSFYVIDDCDRPIWKFKREILKNK